MATDPQYRVLDTSISVVTGKQTETGTITLMPASHQAGQDTVIHHPSVYGVWGPNKTYRIYCTVDIPVGARLEIREGTRIEFMGKFDFGAEGTCIAKGTKEKPIVFTNGTGDAAKNWHWIGTFNNGPIEKGARNAMTIAPDSLLFSNCIFEKGQQLLFPMINPFAVICFEMNNCIFRDLPGGVEFDLFNFDASKLNVGKRIVIRNSVFHDNGTLDAVNPLPLIRFWNGDYLWLCDVPSIEIVNNIFYRENWTGVCYFPHNCYDKNQTPVPDSAAKATSIFDDPKFTDVTKGDYHLLPNSPCRNAGPDGKDMGLRFDE